MDFYLLAALLSPLLYAGMYVLDKYIISRRVFNDNAYLSFVGLVYVLYSLIIAAFLDWSNTSLLDILLPVLVGLIICVQTYFYMILQHKEDISHVTGLEYTYPIIVALLSFIFLREIVSTVAYIGMFIIIIGALVLSVRMRKIKGNLMPIFWLILIVALNEFIIKITSSNTDSLNAAVISLMAFGFFQSLRLISKKTRIVLKKQTLKVWKLVLITEIVGFSSLITLYFAMSGLPATIVSSIAASQALFVLVLERIADKYLGKIIRDHLLLPKLGGILLIILGTVILSFT